jgi:hypothetical protein
MPYVLHTSLSESFFFNIRYEKQIFYEVKLETKPFKFFEFACLGARYDKHMSSFWCQNPRKCSYLASSVSRHNAQSVLCFIVLFLSLGETGETSGLEG